MKLFWTDQALSQLEDIFDHNKLTASLSTAGRIATSIVDKTVLLEKTPRIGTKEELLKKWKKEYRYLVEGNYKIIYWIEDTKRQINIAAIFDCRQNPMKMKEIK